MMNKTVVQYLVAVKVTVTIRSGYLKSPIHRLHME